MICLVDDDFERTRTMNNRLGNATIHTPARQAPPVKPATTYQPLDEAVDFDFWSAEYTFSKPA